MLNTIMSIFSNLLLLIAGIFGITVVFFLFRIAFKVVRIIFRIIGIGLIILIVFSLFAL